MHTKTPLPRGANNYPHTHACIDIAFSTAQVPSPWHHQHVDQAASTTDMLTCAALIVSTAAKHTKPHRKQAVSHPPTKTPQHSNKRFSQHCRTCERVVRASPRYAELAHQEQVERGIQRRGRFPSSSEHRREPTSGRANTC